MHAKSQSNAQAMFNLGYMHEHGQGLPLDLHLAKRYYDEALEHDPAAKLPVTLALTSLWVRKNHADSLLVSFFLNNISAFTLLDPDCDVFIFYIRST
jgi:SEL1 protein